MPAEPYFVDPDIRRAEVLPGELYTSAAWWERLREAVLLRSWHVAGEPPWPAAPGELRPWTMLPGELDEPLLLVGGEDGALRCLSNVCTHRASVLVEKACSARQIRCGYHGRRFALDGRFLSMPYFEEAVDFPRPKDDLAHVPLERLGPIPFVSLEPATSFATLARPVLDRLQGLPLDALVFDPHGSKDYELDAHWALYVDNYLEGLHVPFVHPGLTATLDFSTYSTELQELSSLQIAEAAPQDVAFALPPGHPDAHRRVAAYYFWLFPATMLNFYPWGLSLNVVRAVSPRRTTVAFRSFVWDESLRGRGAGGALDQVQREDEAVVLAVQRGIASRLYRRGRYSPSQEIGVHHFHRLLMRLCSGP